MKLKYYLRGLGIGMVVTAFILSIVLGGNEQTMTDEEVKARAKELGMVESTYLTQIPGQKETQEMESEQESESEPESQPESDIQQDDGVEPETETQSGQEIESEQETQSEQEVESEQETQPEEEKETQTEADTEPVEEEPQIIIITVNPGESSVSVSRSLAEAGLVEDAKEYDKYLCNNGYDKSISIGTYEIPVGATHEEIAKIITKRR